MYCMIPAISPCGKGKTEETVKRLVVTTVQKEGEIKRQTTGFQGSGAILYDATMVDTVHYMPHISENSNGVQRQEHTTPRVNLNVDYWTFGHDDKSIQAHQL